MSSEGNSFSEPLYSQPWQIHSSITNIYTPIHNVPVWLRSVQAQSYSDTCTQIPLQGAEMSVFSVHWFHILPVVAWESWVDGALAIPEANRFYLV